MAECELDEETAPASSLYLQRDTTGVEPAFGLAKPRKFMIRRIYLADIHEIQRIERARL